VSNISLERFYHRIRGKISLVGAYLGDTRICSIIRGCRLKPITAFYNKFNFDTILEPVWIDEFGYRLEIQKKGYTKIKISKRKGIQKTTTDIFKNETVEFIAAHSKRVLIGLSEKKWICIFWCSDNYFRGYIWDDTQSTISICSSLAAGWRVLLRFVQIKYKQGKIMVKSEMKDFADYEWWLIKLPINEQLIDTLNAHTTLKEILINGK